VVALRHDPRRSWRDAIRQAARTAWRRPVAAAAEVGGLAVAATIAVLIPLTAPLAVGFALFVLYVAADRLGMLGGDGDLSPAADRTGAVLVPC
jgi:hypothetical protein